MAITAIVVIAVWRGLHSGLHHAVRTGLKAIVPLILLVIVATAAASDYAQGSHGTVIMSPAWIANGVNGTSNEIATIVIPALPPSPSQAPPSSAVYEAGLVSLFDQQEQKASNDANDRTVPEVVNTLWEASYLYPWGAAQFGDPATAARIDCRYLESTSSVDAATQESVEYSGIAYSISKGWAVYPWPAAAPSPVYFLETISGDPLTASLTAFAACQYVGPSANAQDAADASYWEVTAAGRLNNGDGPDYQDPKTGLTSQDCAAWWTGKVPASDTFPKNGAAFCTGCNGQTESQIVAEGSPSHMTAVTFLTDYNGDDASMAIVYGGFALISALAYAIALGGLAIGVFLAQFILIAMLCVLPVLLLAMAISNKTEEVAKKALMIGVKAVVAKVVFLLLLALLVEFIYLVNRLIGSNSSGLGAVFLTAAAPLLAFYALHTLLRQAGMQGMLSLRGSIATTAGFALGKHQRAPYEGGRNWAERQDSRFQQQLGKLHKGGVRPPDANRPGGTRAARKWYETEFRSLPKEVNGWRGRRNGSLRYWIHPTHRIRLIRSPVSGSGTGKPRGGGAGGAAAPGPTSAPPVSGSGTGKPRGGGAGAVGPTRPRNPFAVPGTPFPGPRDLSVSARNVASGMRQHLASFRSPEALAERKASRTRLYHTGLGALSTTRGGNAVAAGIAGTVAHAGHAKIGWVRARLKLPKREPGGRNSHEIHNRAQGVVDSGKRALRAREIEQRKARRTSRIEGRKDTWRRFGEDMAATGKFHADFAQSRLSSKIAGRRQSRNRVSSNSWASNVRDAHQRGVSQGLTGQRARTQSQPGKTSGAAEQSEARQSSPNESKPQGNAEKVADSHVTTSVPAKTTLGTSPRSPRTRPKQGSALRPPRGSETVKPLPPEPKRSRRPRDNN